MAIVGHKVAIVGLELGAAAGSHGVGAKLGAQVVGATVKGRVAHLLQAAIVSKEGHGEAARPKGAQHIANERGVGGLLHIRLKGGVGAVGLWRHLRSSLCIV